MSDFDVFGKKMIYPTNTDPQKPKPWYLGKDNWRDRAPNWGGTQSTDEHGYLQFKVVISSNNDREIKTRFRVQSIPGQEAVTEKRQDVLRNRKYMGTTKDWKNVEITFYAKINETNVSTHNGGPHFELEARSVLHGDNHHPCEGTALHTNIYPNGRVKLEKELSHTDGYCKTDTQRHQKQNAIHNLMGRWFGMKGVFYDVNDGNVKIEIWLDKNANNNWGTEPVLEYVDAGGWEIDGNDNECDGRRDEKIVWGGPVVIFRSDQLKNFDIKYASVREIIPPL